MKINVGFCGLLTLLLIGLKLGHVIHCGWLLVLLPIWGPWLLVLCILAVLLVICAIADLIAIACE